MKEWKEVNLQFIYAKWIDDRHRIVGAYWPVLEKTRVEKVTVLFDGGEVKAG